MYFNEDEVFAIRKMLDAIDASGGNISPKAVELIGVIRFKLDAENALDTKRGDN